MGEANQSIAGPSSVDAPTTRRWMWVGVVTALSAALHFWDLGRRPLAHDEAIDAWFSWQARGWGVMRYDPVYHGPLRFYLEGPILRWIGTTAADARLLAALCGVIASAVIASSTRWLGRVGAPAAAVLFTISPTILTATRTGREDSLAGLLSLGMLLLVAHALVAPRTWHVVGLGGLLAASFGVKESTFLFGLSALWFFVTGAAIALARPAGACAAAVARLRAVGRDAWIWSLIVFSVVFMVVFTSGFRYIEGFRSGMLDGLRYWWGQHDVGRGGQPWFFHLVVYASYEWLLLGLAAVGAVATTFRRSLVGGWFAWMAVVQIVLYSWAGEKFAWLAMHPLLPAVLLAGLGVDAVVARLRVRGAVVSFCGVAVTAGLAVVTTIVAIRPAITHGADPRELLVTVQTSVDVPPIAARLRSLHDAGGIDSIVVDSSGGGSWPWIWYLHGLDGVSFPVIDQSQPLPDADVVIVLAYEEPPADVPDDATVERFRLREWWVPDYDSMGVDDYVRWFFTRETWSPTGSSDQWVISRVPVG